MARNLKVSDLLKWMSENPECRVISREPENSLLEKFIGDGDIVYLEEEDSSLSLTGHGIMWKFDALIFDGRVDELPVEFVEFLRKNHNEFITRWRKI